MPESSDEQGDRSGLIAMHVRAAWLLPLQMQMSFIICLVVRMHLLCTQLREFTLAISCCLPPSSQFSDCLSFLFFSVFFFFLSFFFAFTDLICKSIIWCQKNFVSMRYQCYSLLFIAFFGTHRDQCAIPVTRKSLVCRNISKSLSTAFSRLIGRFAYRVRIAIRQQDCRSFFSEIKRLYWKAAWKMFFYMPRLDLANDDEGKRCTLTHADAVDEPTIRRQVPLMHAFNLHLLHM